MAPCGLRTAVANQVKIEIVAYQNTWPEEFQILAKNLRQGLGNLALRIDHIGSTSVPGLAAKDIIDIQITVANLGPDLNLAMQKLGYSLPEGLWRDHAPAGHLGPDSDWEKRFFRPPTSQRKSNTHVRIAGKPNQLYPLLFRDFLRKHNKMAEAYAQLKQRLATHLANGAMYPDVKDPAVDLIYFYAEDWAKRTGWQLGESDA
jgi:GrpB-like predicted nucleotidyltransferase (UPF0157 family)